MRRHLSLAILLAITALTACGTRGPLTLPPPQSTLPAANVKAAPAPADLNTAKDPAK